MKRTVEFNTVDICDRLHEFSYKIRIMAPAVGAIEDIGRIPNMIIDLAIQVHDIGYEVHPDQDEESKPPSSKQDRRGLFSGPDSAIETRGPWPNSPRFAREDGAHADDPARRPRLMSTRGQSTWAV
jgi:hypothetical protein